MTTMSMGTPDAAAPAVRRPAPVLMVGNFLNGSIHTRTAAEELCAYLSADGWNVITTSSAINRPARFLAMLWTTWRRRRDYVAAKISVFSGPSFLWAEATAELLHLLGKPVVLSLHGGNLPSFARRYPRRVARLLRAAQVVVAPSAYLQKTLCQFRDDISIIGNPVVIGNYRFRPRRPLRPRLVWLRAFHKIYNPQLAVEVVELLLPRFPDLRLVMTGREKDGTLAATQRLISRKRLDPFITIVPGVPKQEVPVQLDAGDIFINTADVDNAPVTVIEAMASGLPVVTTNPGGIPYLLTNNENALIVPTGDAAAMAAAVTRLLEDETLAASLSAAGRRVAEGLDVRPVIEQWNGVLESLVAEGRP